MPEIVAGFIVVVGGTILTNVFTGFIIFAALIVLGIEQPAINCYMTGLPITAYAIWSYVKRLS